MVIPEFQDFRVPCYLFLKNHVKATPGRYIPQLARISPEYWGMSICTIDGQRYNAGDSKVPFCLQSYSKPLFMQLL